MKTPFLIGRLIFGGFFLYNGINHIKQRQMLSQYAASKKVPQPEAAHDFWHRDAARRSQHSAGDQTEIWAQRR